MSSTGLTELIQSTMLSPTLSASMASVPDNTLIDNNTSACPLTPQLAIHTLSTEEDKESTIDYERQAEQDDPDGPPFGFIFNDPDSCHYYPIHVPNPLHTKVAKYIQYHTNYMYVTGTEGQGHPQHTIPVLIGRKAHHYTPMTTAKWSEFKRGAPQEFIFNKAIADMANPRIIGEVNRLRAKMELKETLDKMLKDTPHCANEISKESLIVEQDLADCMVRVECSNLHTLIQDQLKQSIPIPVHPHHSPELPSAASCHRGLVEMPVGDLCQVKCFRCRKHGHKVQECPQQKKKCKKCGLCGDTTHKKARCPTHRPFKVEGEVRQEVTKEIQELGQLTLLDRIALLNHPEWTPQACSKCGKQNPGHIEVNCPRYEYCTYCRSFGSYGFISRHKCQRWQDNMDVASTGWDDRDHDLWNNGDI